jgi:EpsI family protein
LAISSVPIAIFSNGIRVAGTGIAAHFVGPKAAEGFLHTFSGWLVFLVAGALLLLVHQIAIRLIPGATGNSESDPGASSPGPVPSPAAPDAFAALSMPRAAIAASVLLVAALSLGAITRTEAAGLRQPLRNVPLSLEGWEGMDGPRFNREILEVLRVDEYLNRAYRRAGGPWVSLYVGYYANQRQGQTMHSPLNCMPGAGWEPTGKTRVRIPATRSAAEGTGSGEINRVIVQKGLDRQLVLYWYQAHGRVVASEYWGKVYTVVDAIRLNRSDGAMVRIIVPIPSMNEGAEREAERLALKFAGTFLPVLSSYLDGQ